MEHFISDTAAYADIVLPAAMGAEMEDMILSWGHLYLTYNAKCIEPPGEALPNNEIFRRLAKRLGFAEDNFNWSDSECLQHYVDWNSPACEGIDLEYMRQHGFARLNVGTRDDRAPHKNGQFPTPTGKCHFSIEGAKNFVAGPFRQMYEGFQPGELRLQCFISLNRLAHVVAEKLPRFAFDRQGLRLQPPHPHEGAS